MLNVVDLSPDLRSLASFFASSPWTIGVGVRDLGLLECIKAQCRLALLVESNPRYVDRFQDEELVPKQHHHDFVQALLGADEGAVPWYNYNDSRFDGPLPIEVFQQQYPNLQLRSISQHPLLRLDRIGLDWLDRAVSSREKQSGLLLVVAVQPLAILQGAISLLQWFETVLLLPPEFPSLDAITVGLDQQALDVEALLLSHHFACDPGTRDSLQIWRYQPIKALQADLRASQDFLAQSQQRCDDLQRERDALLQQLEELHLHNSRLAEYRDHLEASQLTLRTQLDESFVAQQHLQDNHDRLERDNRELKGRQQELTVLAERASEDWALLSDRFLTMSDSYNRSV